MVKKRKKKVYKTPKKVKHTHINNKLNIIKCIKNPKCLGCNNRMAIHSDRVACSYCNKSVSKVDTVLHSAILSGF